MKKKFISVTTIITMLFISAIPCSAKDLLADTIAPNKFQLIFNSFKGSISAQIVAVIAFVAIVLFIIFGKKLGKKLDGSTSSQMLNAFIAFFSVFGIACLAMAFASDGATWSNLMYIDPSSGSSATQFSDYILTIQNAGSQRFSNSAADFSPLSLLLHYFLAQFLPPKYVLSESMVIQLSILRNQTFMFLYLILVLMCIVLIYRMNRSVLRRNEVKAKDELVVFLTVVSYPTIYCVERGNILGISLALTIFFVIYHSAKNRILREFSHIALGVSAAMIPLTIFFALLLIKNKKNAVADIAKIATYMIILFITPCVFVGFDCIAIYLQNLITIPTKSYIASNMSISNLLILFGIDNHAMLQIITLIMNVIALICIVYLPKTWQKMSAIVYVMLNVFAISNPVTLIFVFIPFVFLLAEKTHTATDWLYLLSFTLLITPFPEWFRFDNIQFDIFMKSVGIDAIRNANNLIALAATQGIFILICCQLIKQFKSKNSKAK